MFFQFVCFGGSPGRMKAFAFYMVKQLKYKITAGQTLEDISKGSDRYVLYKVGPVLSVSVSMWPNKLLHLAYIEVFINQLFLLPLYLKYMKVIKWLERGEKCSDSINFVNVMIFLGGHINKSWFTIAGNLFKSKGGFLFVH